MRQRFITTTEQAIINAAYKVMALWKRGEFIHGHPMEILQEAVFADKCKRKGKK